jgi:D-alanyl-D-alanine carboxypeptidase (penicillin-binding protein 5/6)
MKKITKYLSVLLTAIIIFTFTCPVFAQASYNDQVNFTANIVLLESLDSGTVIFDKNADLRSAPASLTKITTAMVVIENCKDLDAQVTCSKAAIRSLDGTNSSTAGLLPGEKYTVRQLLTIMLVRSANDAAVVLAYYMGDGDPDVFIAMMNKYVKKLGCKGTHYVNPDGLDNDGQYTTARDLAIITKHALKNNTFVDMVNTLTVKLPAYGTRTSEVSYNTTNYLISPHSQYYYEYAKGVKTGTTDNAGHCLVSTATKNGYTYLCIIMQDQAQDTDGDGASENLAFTESEKAYEWAYDNIKLKVVADTTDIITSVPVKLAKKTDHVRLVPAEKVTALVPSNIDASSVLVEPIKSSISSEILAPVKKGQVLGKARVVYAGQTLTTVDLVAGESVSRSAWAYTGYIIKKIFSSTVAKLIIAAVIIIIAVIIILRRINSGRRKKRRISMVDTRSIRK